jgi:hypothetical protein
MAWVGLRRIVDPQIPGSALPRAPAPCRHGRVGPGRAGPRAASVTEGTEGGPQWCPQWTPVGVGAPEFQS